MKTIDYFSSVPVQIVLWRGDVELGTATGFFYKRHASDYLITNWHVLSGRDANTGQTLLNTGAIPDRIQFLLQAEPLGSTWLSPRKPLLHFDEQQDTTANWFQHPSGQRIDLACIRVLDLPPGVLARFPTANNVQEPLTHEIGSDCYVVGFPLWHITSRETVVWKRATIATEFELGFGSTASFLVDTTSSKGMSGSPVFLRQTGKVRYASGEVGFWDGGPATEFVGVYSGRYLSSDGSELSLGHVWKRELIDEMIDTPTLGNYVLKSPTSDP